jgi:predicted N-acetyltransferase YhbS
MHIDYLAAYPDYIPTLAKCFLEEWRDFYGSKSWEEVASSFYERLNIHKLPLALVAHEQQKPIGTISLLEESISIYKHLSPWLGGLYVHEEKRHQGFGKQLIEAGIREIRRLGYEQVYIGIRKAEEYYESFSWQIVERTTYHGENLVVMRFHLSE